VFLPVRLLLQEAKGKNGKLVDMMSLLDKMIRFHKTRRVLSHVVFWVGIFLLSTASDSYQYHESWLSANRLIFYGLALLTQMLMAYFLAYFILPSFFYTKQYVKVFIYLLTGIYMLCVLSRAINIYVYEPMAGIAPKSFETPAEILTNLPKLLYVYFFRNFSIAIVFLFVKLLIDQYTTQQKTLLLEKEKSDAELRLLKTQLNPHFLFNTLNNIYSLSIVSSPATSASIARLADILDHILYRCNGVLVPLHTEVKLLNNYIELEKLRYDKRLSVNFKTAVSHDIDIAPLILLSLVENAFKHGAWDEMGSPVIDIELWVSDTLFTFIVMNSISSDHDSMRGGAEKGIGLYNLRQQLQLIYGDAYRMEVRQTVSSFTVILTIDLESGKQSV